MQATEPILAKAIRPTAKGLEVILAATTVLVPWAQCSPRLAGATKAERQAAELSPGGYGVHWSLLDEDLSVRGLVRSLNPD